MTSNVSNIQVRDQIFNAEAAADGPWNPRKPELSHAINAVQLALPYLEPYFIDAIKQAMPYIKSRKLFADAQAFCSQEANHSRQHKRYCRALQKRYPKLVEYEAQIRNSLIDSRRNDSLQWRLAYTSGYEMITAQFARTIFEYADDWFDDVDPDFAGLFKWHAAEEIEHRHVAFDVLQDVSRSYGLRVKGVTAALYKSYRDMMPVATYMVEADGVTNHFMANLRAWDVRRIFFFSLAPALLRYIMPGYNPTHDREPAGYTRWKAEQLLQAQNEPHKPEPRVVAG